MNGQGNKREGECGSVLMEFILVAPLYLLLFGGLMLSSDIARLKNKIDMLDVFVTMGGTHRLMQGDSEAVAGQIKDSFRSFPSGSVSSPGAYADLFESRDGIILSNRWNAVYGGRIDVEYKLPAFISSMMEIHRVLYGGKKAAPSSIKFYTYPATGNFPTADSQVSRFHIIQRHWIGGKGDGFDRTVSASKLIGNGVLSNVIGDGWLFTEGTLSVKETDGNDSTYKQQLGDYAE